MKCLVKTALIVFAAGALLACGQKGPLVLPDTAAKHKHSIPTLPATRAPKGTDKGAAPAESSPAASPAPPASPAPAANSTPPQQ